MATIRKLPSGSWNVQIRKNGKIVSSSTHKLHESASAWATAREAEFNLLVPHFRDAGYQYCHEILEAKPSQRMALNRIDWIAGHPSMQQPMDQISLEDINNFKRWRMADVSTTTCRDELMMIKRVFKWYICENYSATSAVLENPCELLVIPKANKARDKVVTRDELLQLLAAMTPQMAVIVELAYETAMRRGELLKITPKDLFLKDRFLRVVDGKEGSRDVPLTRRAVALLQGQLRDGMTPNQCSQ